MESRLEEGTLWVSANVIAPRALMSIETVLTATLGALGARDASGLVAEGVFHGRVDGFMVVFAAVRFTIIAEMVQKNSLTLPILLEKAG